jgi:hypothetical protein
MKIEAVGANRRVYKHKVVDIELSEVNVIKKSISFNLLSETDPGIGTGQYMLSFSLTKKEVFLLFDAAMTFEADLKIKKMEKEISELKELLEKSGLAKKDILGKLIPKKAA